MTDNNVAPQQLHLEQTRPVVGRTRVVSLVKTHDASC